MVFKVTKRFMSFEIPDPRLNLETTLGPNLTLHFYGCIQGRFQQFRSASILMLIGSHSVIIGT